MYFTKDGVLPRGDFELTINELRQSVLIKGENDLHVWDEQWRIYLIDQLEILVQELWKVEVDQIFIDGSFVENKCALNGIVRYFECDWMAIATGKVERKLNALKPHKIWSRDNKSNKP